MQLQGHHRFWICKETPVHAKVVNSWYWSGIQFYLSRRLTLRPQTLREQESAPTNGTKCKEPPALHLRNGRVSCETWRCTSICDVLRLREASRSRSPSFTLLWQTRPGYYTSPEVGENWCWPDRVSHLQALTARKDCTTVSAAWSLQATLRTTQHVNKSRGRECARRGKPNGGIRYMWAPRNNPLGTR